MAVRSARTREELQGFSLAGCRKSRDFQKPGQKRARCPDCGSRWLNGHRKAAAGDGHGNEDQSTFLPRPPRHFWPAGGLLDQPVDDSGERTVEECKLIMGAGAGRGCRDRARQSSKGRVARRRPVKLCAFRPHGVGRAARRESAYRC